MGQVTRMKSTMKSRVLENALYATLTLALVAISSLAHAQTAGRVVGTVSAVSANSITVKTDADGEKQVAISADSILKRLAPGQKDLSAAAIIQLSDIAIGDRVLVRLDPSADTPQASLVIAMKQSDLALKQQEDLAAWQRGVKGLVKKVDPAVNSIVVTTGAGPTAKSVTVQVAQSTVLLRYAPDSVRFADAKPAPLSAIKPGDQLRARGVTTADGTQIAANAIISGTFRNIGGTIVEVDAGASNLVVKDLATKKQVTIHVGSDVKIRRIPDRMAQMIAMRLKGAGSFGGAQGHMGNGAAGANSAHSPAAGSGGARWAAGQNGGAGMGSGDPQQFLSLAPVIQLADLHKGEAVMVVATDGTTDVNAITLLAGVEPLLEAPSAVNLLSNWSMGGGGADAAAETQ